MATGIVKFYDPIRGFGFIATDDSADVYVHTSAIVGIGYRYLVAGESVEFDVGLGPDGRPRALSVRSIAGRLRGVVKAFDHKKGFGFIAPDEPGGDVFMHFTAVLGDGVRTAVAGEVVEYEIIQGERGLQAVKIKRLDPRLPLFRFATMGVGDQWLEDLKGLAEHEPGEWDFHRHEDEEPTDPDDDERPRHRRYPILRSYLTYTFDRLEEEGKIAFGADGRRKFACFNTGLVTPMQEEIFSLFEEARPESGNAWRWVGYHKKSDRGLMSKFKELPALANYFEDPTVLIYDRRKELYIDADHIIRDNIDRFPDSCRNNEYLARQLLESARAITQQRVYRNYKTAIPQFHRGEIQLLLPLCLERADRADLALVVSRVGDQYRGDTVLTLEMAYNNARLLTRPDRDWLTP